MCVGIANMYWSFAVMLMAHGSVLALGKLWPSVTKLAAHLYFLSCCGLRPLNDQKSTSVILLLHNYFLWPMAPIDQNSFLAAQMTTR